MMNALTNLGQLTKPRAGQPAPGEVDDPSRELRWGILVASLFFILFLGWAAFAPLDAAANAPGRLVVSGQRQAVQHRDGGVVGEILVKEGQRVERGQVLLRLAASEVRAQERALTSQTISLLAQRARLQAEQLGLATITAPVEFASLAPQDQAAARQTLQLQQVQLRTRAAVLAAQKGVLGQRGAQARQQGQGYSSQVVSAQDQLKLINDEIDSLQSVAEKGFVSKNRIRALERARAELEGQRGQYVATVAQSRESAGESRLQALEAERSHQEKVASELREVETALNDALPRLNAARDQLARTEIRSPATGVVVGMTVFTPGGVISAGQKLMDVVPVGTPLLIEARVSPADADDLRVGQLTYVRFDTLNERSLPNLEGALTRLSADSFTDEKTGEQYFTAEVVVPREQLDLIQERRGSDFELRAGMPVQVQVPTRKRTALQYAFEPITDSLWKSFGEQ